MSPASTTLIQLRHDRDLRSLLRAAAPPTEGVISAVLAELVGRRQRFPVQASDGAFGTLDALVVATGAPTTDVVGALERLEARRLVESCGSAVNATRWRATEHAMFAVPAPRVAA